MNIPKGHIPEKSNLRGKLASRRTAAISRIIQQAISERADSSLSTSESPLAQAIYGLVAFYEHHFPEDEILPLDLPQNLLPVHEALLGSFVREFLNEMHARSDQYFLTQGSEGKIYRIRTASGDYIIAKRRFDASRGTAGTDRECELQTAARKISKRFDGVSVPKIFSRIPDAMENCEYVVMECVRGKTLYALALESIANGGTMQKTLDFDASENPVERFYQSRAHFPIKFDNDTDAELSMIEHYRPIAEERGLPDPGIRVRGPDGKESLPYFEALLKEDLGKIQVFEEGVVRHVGAKLRPFLAASHESGVYHRDLNIRNLMLAEDGTIYVIDYGKGIKVSGPDDSVYDTQEGKCDSDFSILDLVKSYGPKKQTEADLIRAQTERARESLEFSQLRRVAETLGLDPDETEKMVRRMNSRFDSRYFELGFLRYVDGTAERIDPSHFIQSNPKKPEARKASQAGKMKLLAELFLSGKEEIRKFWDYLLAVDPKSLGNGSKAKEDRAEKYWKLFVPIVAELLS